jgi:peroxiredoxin
MSLRHVPWIFVGAVALPALVTWLTADGKSEAALPGTTLPTKVAQQEPHFVTPRQLVASLEASERHVLPLEGMTEEGATVCWDELSSGKPVVFVFIKAGCPCNIEFQPYFHRAQGAYGDRVRFVGVIDGCVAVAKAYAQANRVPYPILADEQRVLFQKFKVTNGAYVALVDRQGMIDSLWPGCSTEMMQHLGQRICGLTGSAEQVVDYTGLPGALTSGCPIER